MYQILCGLVEIKNPTKGFTFFQIMIVKSVSLTSDCKLQLNIHIFSHKLTYDGITLMTLQKCPITELPVLYNKYYAPCSEYVSQLILFLTQQLF
jgi:hypothetical protein